MQDEQVIQIGNRFRVQRADGSLLRGVFHNVAQADEHRLQLVAARVLRLVSADRNSMPGRHNAAAIVGIDRIIAANERIGR